MRRRDARIVRGLVLAASGSAALATRPAAGSEVRVVSRTVGEGYAVAVPGGEGEVLSRRRMAQYVNLNVESLLPPRDPRDGWRRLEDGQLRIVTSLRFLNDFGTFARNPEAGPLRTGDGRQFDLMFGYLAGERLGGHVDFRLGRQFEMSGLDWYAFDGAWVRVRLPAHLGVETFGGLQVRGAAILGVPNYELDGSHGTAADRAPSPMVGAGFSLLDLPGADVRVAYRRTFSPGRSVPGLELPAGEPTPAVDQEVISGVASLQLLRARLFPYAAGRYNLGTARLDDVSAGLSLALGDRHDLRVAWVRAFPAFDLDSVFNVFSLTAFQDARVVWEVRPAAGWRLHARGQSRVFRNDPTLGAISPDRTLRPAWGGGVGAVHQRRRLALRLDAFGLGGEGGLRAGVSADTRVHVLWDRLALDGRAYYTQYKDDLSQGRQGYSVALQSGINLRLRHGVYLNLMGEELISRQWASSLRVLGVLSVDLQARVGAR